MREHQGQPTQRKDGDGVRDRHDGPQRDRVPHCAPLSEQVCGDQRLAVTWRERMRRPQDQRKKQGQEDGAGVSSPLTRLGSTSGSRSTGPTPRLEPIGGCSHHPSKTRRQLASDPIEAGRQAAARAPLSPLHAPARLVTMCPSSSTSIWLDASRTTPAPTYTSVANSARSSGQLLLMRLRWWPPPEARPSDAGGRDEPRVPDPTRHLALLSEPRNGVPIDHESESILKFREGRGVTVLISLGGGLDVALNPRSRPTHGGGNL